MASACLTCEGATQTQQLYKIEDQRRVRKVSAIGTPCFQFVSAHYRKCGRGLGVGVGANPRILLVSTFVRSIVPGARARVRSRPLCHHAASRRLPTRRQLITLL